jgi:hypothetical protein
LRGIAVFGSILRRFGQNFERLRPAEPRLTPAVGTIELPDFFKML